MMNRTYLDTSILLQAIIAKSQARSDATSILNRIRALGYQVIIPHVVVGESLSQIIAKSDNIPLSTKELLEWIQNLVPAPRECMPPASRKICELAVELLKGDDRIDSCDAIIVSHALLDPDSQYLLTTDTEIRDSSYIQNKIEELRSNLKIVDSLV